jgi:hypothetical protein
MERISKYGWAYTGRSVCVVVGARLGRQIFGEQKSSELFTRWRAVDDDYQERGRSATKLAVVN